VAAPWKRLFFDIETSLQEAVLWSTGKQYVGPDNITVEHGIICISWKWHGAKPVYSLTWDENLDDRAMLSRFVPIMHSADEIVGHNSDRFDTPWIRARCVLQGIPMSPDFTSVDTLKGVRSKLRRTRGNRLDAIAESMGLPRKLPTGGIGLWKRCLEHDAAALRAMVRYNKQDVRVLELVYDRLAPYLPAKSHRGASLIECPEGCGRAMTVQKRRPTATRYRKVQLQCQRCGKYLTLAESRYDKAKAEAERAA
jgi:DNA polymerase III epsilon subunit-like protein